MVCFVYNEIFYDEATFIQKGGNGSVFKVTLKHRVTLSSYKSKYVAMKLYKNKDTFMFEKHISELLPKHPNIIEYLGCVHVPIHLKDEYYNIGILYEYVDGISLADVIDENELNDIDKLTMIYTIINAIKYLHNDGIYHRDIKSGNIMVRNETKEPVIIDFDSGCIIKGKRENVKKNSICIVENVGTNQFMEPFMQGYCNITDNIFDSMLNTKKTQKLKENSNIFYKYYIQIQNHASNDEIALYLEKCDNWSLVILTYDMLFLDLPDFIEHVYDDYYITDLIDAKKTRKKLHGCHFHVNSNKTIQKLTKIS